MIKKLIIILITIYLFPQTSFAKAVSIECEIKDKCSKGGTLYIDDRNISDKIAIILFLPGGEGNYGDMSDNKATFLRHLRKDTAIVIMNPGYNMPNPRGDPPLRYSDDYQEKIRSSILYLKKTYNKPVWLKGHSAGGPGVAGFLKKNIKSEDYLSGVIYSGANIKSYSGDNQKNLPILIIHHKDDGCKGTLYYGAIMKLDKYKKNNNSVTKLVTIEGGGGYGDPCEGYNAYHFFTGKETAYGEAIIKFIKENTK